MITLTEKATEQVKQFISGQQEPYEGIRLSVHAGGCSGFEYKMQLERTERDGDQVIKSSGFNLYIDEQSLIYLSGTEIDFVESSTGAGFAFKNPNSKGSCGCGESFTV